MTGAATTATTAAAAARAPGSPSRSRRIVASAGAGLAAGVAQIPDSMATAVLAGTGAAHGIYAAVVGTLVAALTTSSPLMSVVPTSALAMGTAEALAGNHGAPPLVALATLVVLTGAIQATMGLLGFGSLLRFVSNAVMTGFLTAIGILIVISQVGAITGYHSRYGHPLLRAADALMHPGALNAATLLLAAGTAAVVLLLDRTRLRMLAVLIAVAAATVAAAFWGGAELPAIGPLPRSLPHPTLPRPGLLAELAVPALGLAVIGLVQGAGVSHSYPGEDGRYPSLSRDFVGQGLANVASGLVQGVAVGGSVSGTALLVRAGAVFRVANVVAALATAACALLMGPLVARVPLAALGAVLVLAGVRAIDVGRLAMVVRTGWPAGAIALGTLAATLLLPLRWAVLIGVASSIVLHVYRAAEKVALRAVVPCDGGGWMEAPDVPAVLPCGRVTILQPYGSLFFAGARALEEALPKIGSGTTSRRAVVVLLLRGRKDLGSTFVGVIDRYARALRQQDGRLLLVGVEESVERQLARTGVLGAVGAANVFPVHPRYGEALSLAWAAAQHRLTQ